MDSGTLPILYHICQHRHEPGIYVDPREYAIESLIPETDSWRAHDQHDGVLPISPIYDIF